MQNFCIFFLFIPLNKQAYNSAILFPHLLKESTVNILNFFRLFVLHFSQVSNDGLCNFGIHLLY